MVLNEQNECENPESQERLREIMFRSKPEKLRLAHQPAALLRMRTTSSMWDSTFDPFQVFEVEHEACLDFEITIKRGEGITKGSSLKDFMDTPDPYVILRIPGCSNSSKRTSHVDNCANPIWDESFHFFLDPAQEHTLYVTLMDANYTMDETLGEDTFCVNELTMDQPKDYVFVFPGRSKVHATLKLQKNKNPDLRFSLALCNAEKDFLITRRKKILHSMQKLLGDNAPETERQVPIVAILGSGGGFRAMTCLSGAVKALHESGIIDCATYVAGLSGSSWYISTLYAHDLFPNITHSHFQEELRESVTTNWKWQLLRGGSYIASMVAKYKKGQPISFTDFFGHLLGDVLLKGKKQKKLTDMRKFLVQGSVPLPLFTCLHAKRNVSCRSFSEWVEFSPYEIGIAKYGTFMKTEDFGNKFIVGKKIKHFDELPLHFLQGVWGSAFTILFKRLVMEGGKKDIVQIMRDAAREAESEIQDKINESRSSEDDTDTDEDIDIVGKDDIYDSDSDYCDTEDKFPLESHVENHNFPTEHPIPEEPEVSTRRKSEMNKSSSVDNASPSLVGQSASSQLSRLGKSVDSLSLGTQGNHVENTQSKGELEKDLSVGLPAKMKKGFSFELPKRKISKDNNRKFSTESDPGGRTEFQTAMNSRLSRKGAVRGPRIRKQDTADSSKELKTAGNGSAADVWANRRKTLRESRAEKKAGLLDGLKQSIMTGTNILNSRAGRAGEILNPFRGLSLKHSFPLSPFAMDGPEEEEDELDAKLEFGKGCRYEPLDNKAKKLFIVDSGLAFNSPFPLLLRPQRAVDIYLSFDFSQRPEDNHPPFKELLLAEKWAIQNKVPFPPVEKQVAEFKNDKEVRECYVFKHPSDHFCPVILHFPLVNNKFKEFKAPGVPRTTEEEKKFADFPIFDDPNNPYSSMNFVYTPLQFERLTKLVEFNTLLCMDLIKKELEEVVSKKKQYMSKPMTLRDVVSIVKRVSLLGRNSTKSDLSLKLSMENEIQLKNYARQSQRMERQESRDSSEDEFSDAVEEQPEEDNS